VPLRVDVMLVLVSINIVYMTMWRLCHRMFISVLSRQHLFLRSWGYSKFPHTLWFIPHERTLLNGNLFSGVELLVNSPQTSGEWGMLNPLRRPGGGTTPSVISHWLNLPSAAACAGLT
jgi:hypothetical protein